MEKSHGNSKIIKLFKYSERHQMLSWLLRTCGYIVICLVAAFFATELHAESSTPQEYKVKAAFIYNFAKFIEWPEKSFAKDYNAFELCIIGKDPFGDAIKTIEGKTVKEKELMVKRIKMIEDIGSCSMLFISESEENGLSHILENIKHKHILSVADMEGFAHRGGIINFIMTGKNVRFEINVNAAQLAELQISSKLLRLSKIIKNNYQEDK